MKFVGTLRWHHVVITTYGQWLPGDPRGFRTRGHREHVDGDYKRPPKEDYSARHQRSKAALKSDPVCFDRSERERVSDILLCTLDHYELEAAAIGVAATHAHLLAKLPSGNAEQVIAQLKREVTTALRREGRLRIWGRRFRATWINDCSHWTNTLRYIRRHGRDGACVWLWEGPHETTATTACDPAAIRDARVAQRVAERGANWMRRRATASDNEAPRLQTRGLSEQEERHGRSADE